MSGWREQLKKLYDGTESTISTQLPEKGNCVDCLGIVPRKPELKTHTEDTTVKLLNDEIVEGDMVETVEKDVALVVVKEPPLRKCSSCTYDKPSPVNPSGGLTWCSVRDDVTPMVPGARKVRCAAYLERSMEQHTASSCQKPRKE